MAKFKLAFGLHNHQPVGNFEAVFEEAHQKAYQSFIDLVRQHEHLRFSLHQSGILWRWQERAHPDYFQQVGDLVDAGRIELMTGGFYEPILISVPERDALGQIDMLNRYIADHFEVKPTGLWLTERIWEPHLPRLLADAGVKYLPIDDTHFLYAGFENGQLTGPYITESEGSAVTLLPIQKKLRYLIPFGKVEEVIAELRNQAERNPGGLAVYADDGEKFGVWPKTYEHCYQDQWLNNFFQAIAENSDWLELIPLSEAAALPPVGRAYLPTASYAEMLQWALPPIAFLEYEQFERWLKKEDRLTQYGRFVRGGHWRGFLAKYDESNLMHKKMLDVSEHLTQVEQEFHNEADVVAARDRLYAGQCNCPYWHGVFGGLYLPHIRQAVYSSLIRADRILNQVEGIEGINVETRDYDFDGYEEVVVKTSELNGVIKPSRGGSLLDLSLNRHDFSITDTLTRRREGYHLKLDQAVVESASDSKTETGDSTASIHDLVLAKEDGLKKFLVEDWYLKRCFIDHFLTADVNLEKFMYAKYGEEGDFIVEPYECVVEDDGGRVELVREGHLWRPEGVIPIRVNKSFQFIPGSPVIQVQYRLERLVDYDIEVRFAVENNFTFQAGHAEDRYIEIDDHRPDESFLDSIGGHGLCRAVALVDEYRGLAVRLYSDQPGEVWHHPIFTVSLSEGGFEKVYQGTTLMNLYHIRLGHEPAVLNLSLYAGALAEKPTGSLAGSAARS
ncbi:MAG TPA: DUF1926 domain-containing protein [candidate division Zixibacteria bacterium]|nr:DUF1926 domain-containing protein [candidate division Zixibacteria bacterium]